MKFRGITAVLSVGIAVATIADTQPGVTSRVALKTRITVSPTYPEESLSAGREGSTIVCFYVDTDGKVNDAVVLSSTHPDFESAALSAARRTVYVAPSQDDTSDNYTCLRYRFRLE